MWTAARTSGLAAVFLQSASASLLAEFAEAGATLPSPLRVSFTENARHEHDAWGGWRDASNATRAEAAAEAEEEEGGLAVAAVNAHIGSLSHVFISPSNSMWTSFVGHLMEGPPEIQSFACAPGRSRTPGGGYLRLQRATPGSRHAPPPWDWTEMRRASKELGCPAT